MKKKSTDKPDDLRVGVFICDCGSNIAGHLDCKSVTDYASGLPGVVYSNTLLFHIPPGGHDFGFTSFDRAQQSILIDRDVVDAYAGGIVNCVADGRCGVD